MKFHILTIFPKIFDSYISESIIKRAQEKGLIKIQAHNIRDYATDKHNKVDDKVYGGGPGMVMKVEPIYKAVSSIKYQVLSMGKRGKKPKVRTILFSTRGKKFDNTIAKRLSKYDQLILICGRYEGVDERVAKYVADEEISIGDYVLSGGELPALVLLDAVSRQIQGVLGKMESLEEIKGSYEVYTRPEEFKAVVGRKSKIWRVPKVLVSGHHKKIDQERGKA
ncbi:MAG: tRNA (guanosine(37)-N1)-methyltransferase TrmD [bacterium]|nr:tRNA (guanosine(37)-N1)-methyltransferase TrmD [bacterium]